MRISPKQQLCFDFIHNIPKQSNGIWSMASLEPTISSTEQSLQYQNATWQEIERKVHEDLLINNKLTDPIDLSKTHNNLLESIQQQDTLVSPLCSTPLLDDVMKIPAGVLHLLTAIICNEDITVNLDITYSNINISNINSTIHLKANEPEYIMRSKVTNTPYLLPNPTCISPSIKYNKKEHPNAKIHILGYRIHKNAEKQCHNLHIPNVLVYEDGYFYSPNNVPDRIAPFCPLFCPPFKPDDVSKYPIIKPIPIP